MNLIIFYDHSKDILSIVNKYRKAYNASVYEIKPTSSISFFDKFLNNPKNDLRCNLNLLDYQTIILIIPLWFGKVPSPVVKFLEEQTGKINDIIYLFYNNNKGDKPKEFDKVDRILNLRRSKSYFVTLNKKEIHVRVYQ